MSRRKTIDKQSEKSPEVIGKRDLPAAKAAFFNKVIPIMVDAENLKRQRMELSKKLRVQIARSKALRNMLWSLWSA
jgi:hypothetical protein